jgi:hypothetical protein
MYLFFHILKTVFEHNYFFCSAIYNIVCNTRYIVGVIYFMYLNTFLWEGVSSFHLTLRGVHGTKGYETLPQAVLQLHKHVHKREFLPYISMQVGPHVFCRALLGFYAASIGSFLPFRDNSWRLWNSHSGVGEDSSHLGRCALLTGQFIFIFRANRARWRHYVPPKRPQPFTSRQGIICINTCVRTSCLIE